MCRVRCLHATTIRGPRGCPARPLSLPPPTPPPGRADTLINAIGKPVRPRAGDKRCPTRTCRPATSLDRAVVLRKTAETNASESQHILLRALAGTSKLTKHVPVAAFCDQTTNVIKISYRPKENIQKHFSWKTWVFHQTFH